MFYKLRDKKRSKESAYVSYLIFRTPLKRFHGLSSSVFCGGKVPHHSLDDSKPICCVADGFGITNLLHFFQGKKMPFSPMKTAFFASFRPTLHLFFCIFPPVSIFNYLHVFARLNIYIFCFIQILHTSPHNPTQCSVLCKVFRPNPTHLTSLIFKL